MLGKHNEKCLKRIMRKFERIENHLCEIITIIESMTIHFSGKAELEDKIKEIKLGVKQAIDKCGYLSRR